MPEIFSFFNPLKDFLKDKGVEELEKIPFGVFGAVWSVEFF